MPRTSHIALLSLALLAASACGSDRAGGLALCSTGGHCINGTEYQACTSPDGKSCTLQLGAQKFVCLSCGNCSSALTELANACTSSPVVKGPTIGGDDLGGVDTDPPDLAHTVIGFDLATPTTKYGCNGFVQCYISCFNANPSATSASCESSCATLSKPTAQTSFNSALSCGQTYCLGSSTTPYKCKLDTSGTSLLNIDGSAIASTDPTTGNTGTKDCGQCLNDSLAKLFGGPCEAASSADCSTALSNAEVTACGAQTNACLNDLP